MIIWGSFNNTQGYVYVEVSEDLSLNLQFCGQQAELLIYRVSLCNQTYKPNIGHFHSIF